MFLLSAKSSVDFNSFPFSQLWAGPNYKKAEVIQSDFLVFVCCGISEAHTSAACFSAFSLPVRFRIPQTWKCQWQFGSVSVLWILDWSCQTNYSAKGNGIIIPPLKMADHRYLPVSGTLCVKICASSRCKYFTHKCLYTPVELHLT